MCVDYRALNDCTADASWPIPNIAEMFRRIGSQKPKIFGKLQNLTTCKIFEQVHTSG